LEHLPLARSQFGIHNGMSMFVASAKTRASLIRASMLLLLILLNAANTRNYAIAQGRNFSTFFLDVVPSKFVAAALAQPYGHAVVKEFAAALSDSADPQCLKAKGMTKDQLSDRARALLLQRGTYMLERLLMMTNRAMFKNYLKARIGREGIAELDRLRNDPNVRVYRAIDEPAELAYIAASIVDNIDHYTRITKIKLARPISPIASDIQSIAQADPTDEIDTKLKEMVANDKSGVLVRYVEITAMAQQPFRDATNMKIAMKFGPGELLARPDKDNLDLYNELVNLCVARRMPQ
jgi:hypothetical protein